MLDRIYKDAEEKMGKTREVLKSDFKGIRTGRATPHILDHIKVDYYGSTLPINQLSTISCPESRLIVIKPYDKSYLPQIQKAIMKSDLSLNPTTDGVVIRISIPPLTADRRCELDKVIKKMAEEAKVSIRSIRRDANEKIRRLEEKGEISEDEERRAKEKIQELTDTAIKDVEEILVLKEKEILEE
ncbi:MAG: ribosome recycling factor [bacterium]|nr:ribosome recycling factor [bacterium]